MSIFFFTYTLYVLMLLLKLNKATRSINDAWANQMPVDRIGQFSFSKNKCKFIAVTSLILILFFLGTVYMSVCLILRPGFQSESEALLVTDILALSIISIRTGLYLLLYFRFRSAVKRIKLISKRIKDWYIVLILLYIGELFPFLAFELRIVIHQYSALY